MLGPAPIPLTDYGVNPSERSPLSSCPSSSLAHAVSVSVPYAYPARGSRPAGCLPSVSCPQMVNAPNHATAPLSGLKESSCVGAERRGGEGGFNCVPILLGAGQYQRTVCKKTRPHWLDALSFLPPSSAFSLIQLLSVPGSAERRECPCNTHACAALSCSRVCVPVLARLAGDLAHPCGRARCHT